MKLRWALACSLLYILCPPYWVSSAAVEVASSCQCAPLKLSNVRESCCIQQSNTDRFRKAPAAAFTSPGRRAPMSRAAAVQAPITAGQAQASKLQIHGLHHVGFLIDNLERSMEFYRGVLDLEINETRPDDKLPYRGAWLMLGPDMLHLMECKNPDPKELTPGKLDCLRTESTEAILSLQGRAEHGGQDRHICVGVPSIQPFVERLEAHNIPFTKSKSGRQALFFRDIDMNTIEVVQQDMWR